MATNQGAVRFNVGGHKYEVSRSLLHQHSSTMLARSVSAPWKEDGSNSEVFIERDGERFGLVLDYLRDGKVTLPPTVAISSFLTDLEYYCVENINTDTITYDGGSHEMNVAEMCRSVVAPAIFQRANSNGLDLALACFAWYVKKCFSFTFAIRQEEDKGLYDIAAKVHKCQYRELSKFEYFLSVLGLRLERFTHSGSPKVYHIVVVPV